MKAFKSFFPLLIAAVAIWVPATGFGLTPETDLNDNIIAPVEGAAGAVAFAGVGPAVAGSVDYSKLPSKARKFLERYCDGHAIVRCDKTYASSTYTVGLANGILMTFDSKGAITDITAPENYSLSPYLLKAVVPGKLYNLLEHNGFRDSVEGVHEMERDGYRLEICDPVFNEICFDKSGILTVIAER